ncbi:phosphoadenylyl-sulfate reductase [Rhodohalobacter sulfatireducens]|uniref:Adenosine 5'-phosphosulfate reductase n=1 Tax=Rhodohalobacter sulfatireducens TaxID=2911366 RepID=A0ABS9K9J1_9BACT|nr:phosphoadenylyl-sulfate reductase [Rhodohalobacter sulfatireducens]MCG2587517.1 phosphoadenylyl-sulfate reductase [Rhodohalobacter sulfatireducens]
MKTETKEVLLKDSVDVKTDDLPALNNRFEHQLLDDLLIWAFEQFGNELVLGTGFGPSGVVLIHKITQLNLPVKVFCLDTNLLFDETYSLWDKIEKRFNITIESVSPILTLEGQATLHEEEMWKSNPDRCCYLRKVLPLQKYLSNKKGWITGLRRSQSDMRKGIDKIEWDSSNKVFKLNPLADWSQGKIWDHIDEHNLPYNPLHDEGYPSIGCIPCTEPSKNQDERSGRWKNMEKTECGIHLPNLQNKK